MPSGDAPVHPCTDEHRINRRKKCVKEGKNFWEGKITFMAPDHGRVIAKLKAFLDPERHRHDDEFNLDAFGSGFRVTSVSCLPYLHVLPSARYTTAFVDFAPATSLDYADAKDPAADALCDRSEGVG